MYSHGTGELAIVRGWTVYRKHFENLQLSCDVLKLNESTYRKVVRYDLQIKIQVRYKLVRGRLAKGRDKSSRFLSLFRERPFSKERRIKAAASCLHSLAVATFFKAPEAQGEILNKNCLLLVGSFCSNVFGVVPGSRLSVWTVHRCYSSFSMSPKLFLFALLAALAVSTADGMGSQSKATTCFFFVSRYTRSLIFPNSREKNTNWCHVLRSRALRHKGHSFLQGKVQISPISALLRWRHFRPSVSLSLSLSLSLSAPHAQYRKRFCASYSSKKNSNSGQFWVEQNVPGVRPQVRG